MKLFVKQNVHLFRIFMVEMEKCLKKAAFKMNNMTRIQEIRCAVLNKYFH